jgi:signal transduction histidine kinase
MENMDSALALLNKGIIFFANRKDLKAQAELYHELAALHNMSGSLQLAQIAGEESLRMYTLCNQRKGIAAISNVLGVVQAKKNDYSSATRLFLRALGIFSSLTPPDTQGIISSYVKLGLVNDYTGNTSQAISFYKKGLDLAMSMKDTSNIIHLLNNMGVLHAKRGNKTLARSYFNQSMDWVKYREEEQLAPLLNIGNIYSNINTPEGANKALYYYNKAEVIARKYNKYEDMVRLQINISGLEYKLKPADAIRTLIMLNDELKSRHMPQLRIDALNQLIEISEDLGNFKQALDYWKERTTLKDSLMAEQQLKEIADLQSVYDLELSRKRMTELEESNQRNASQRNIILIFSVGIFSVLVALFYIYKKRSDLNKLLIRREEQLTRAGEMKDRIFTIIGHDLRNAVGNVPALIQIYKDADTTEQERELILENLQLNATVTFETLNNMLEWGKAQMKGVMVNRKIFNVSDAIRHTVRLFNIAIQQKGIRFVDSVPRELNLHTDEAHFAFIIRNLLSNAIKFTDKGGFIEIGVLRSDAADEIILFVKDNGVGIEQERIELIFSKGGVSTEGTSQEGGNGLGLMLCREFVEKSNGRIWASGIPRQGTTFYVTFTKSV